MQLLIDIDGVIADQVTPVLKKLNQQLGLSVTREQIRTWDEPIGPTDIKTEIEAALLDPEFVLTMDLIDGAREALAMLARSHQITIATNRAPEATLPTKQWLARNSIPYSNYINTAVSGKGKLVGDVLVDDYPGNALDFSNSGMLAILFGQPWNTGDESANAGIADGRMVRAQNWGHVVEIINSTNSRLAADEL